jgi:hypothetical protein
LAPTSVISSLRRRRRGIPSDSATFTNFAAADAENRDVAFALG